MTANGSGAAVDSRPPAVEGRPGDRPTFATVYDEHVSAVWRFLRARVGDHHLAQDLTSEVFMRAWRSWERFDHARGSVEPWLWAIAHRTLVDHWRRRRPDAVTLDDEDVTMTAHEEPEHQAVQQDLLHRLGAAIGQLRPHERDVLALRFAARLTSDQVAAVLDLGVGATRMLLHRTVGRLRHLVGDDLRPAVDVGPADLEAIIDDILERGEATGGDRDLRALLLHLAVHHDGTPPPHLHEDVAACVACEAPGADRSATPPVPPSAARRRPGRRGVLRALLAGPTFGMLFFVPVCLACTVSVASLVVGSALGGASLVVHEAMLFTTPLILWLVARARRRHGGTLGLRVAAAGALLLAVHTGLHVHMWVGSGAAIVEDSALAASAFAWANQLGTALLAAGTAISWERGRRWRRQEAELLSRIAVARHRAGLAPA